MNVKNLPRPTSAGITIEGRHDERDGPRVVVSDGTGGVTVYSMPYHHRVVDLITAHPDVGTWLAAEFASVIREARDRGFEQGRAHVREALGIK